MLVEIYSPMVKTRRIGLDLAFPYVNTQLNPDPTDWSHPERHTTSEVSRTLSEVIVHRQLDGDVYWVRMRVEGGARLSARDRINMRSSVRRTRTGYARAWNISPNRQETRRFPMTRLWRR